jgi:hypothetical protein
MENELSGQDVAIGSTSPDISETNTPPLLGEPESSSQNSAAVLKTAAKTKSGGVKLGSFRLGGRKKTNSEEESTSEVKEAKKSKKTKKDKGCDDSDKQDSDGSSTSSPGTKQSIPGKASSLVRKLSIGKYKASGSKKTLKSPDTPSSQEEYQSVSTEEELFVTQSPKSAANGHPSVEVSATAGEDAPRSDILVTSGSIMDSSTQTTPANTDPLPVLESTTQHQTDVIVNGQQGNMIVGEAVLPKPETNSVPDNMAAFLASAYKSARSQNGVFELPSQYSGPAASTLTSNAEDDEASELWYTQASADGVLLEDEDKRPAPKNRLQYLKSRLTPELRKELEEQEKLVNRLCDEAQERAEQAERRKDMFPDYGMFPLPKDEASLRSGATDMIPVMLLRRLRFPVSPRVLFFTNFLPTEPFDNSVR